jgi:hypothetical protein
MTAADYIKKKEIKELLAKGWLTHDAMWFYSVYKKMGIDQANEFNLAAIRAQAPVEVSRLQKFLDHLNKPIGTLEDLNAFMQAAFEITLPKSVSRNFQFKMTSPGRFHWEWEPGNCFAYKGMQKLGILDTYRCGVMYRIECWLDTLGVTYQMNPFIDTCIMSTTGSCSGSITVEVDS